MAIVHLGTQQTWHDPTTGGKHGKPNRRSNNTAHYARKKRVMITRRENFGGTAPSHFLRQTTVVNVSEDQASVTSQQGVLTTLHRSTFHHSKSFSNGQNIFLPSGASPLESRVLPHLEDKDVFECLLAPTESRVLTHPEGKNARVITRVRGVSGAPSPRRSTCSSNPERHSSPEH